MTYKIAAAHDNAAGLTTVTPQPACEGIQYPRMIRAASGKVYPDGQAYCEWRYGPELDETVYNSLLTQFGLTSVWFAEVTVATVSSADRVTFSNYNGRIIRPQVQYSKGFYRNVVFLVSELEAI